MTVGAWSTDEEREKAFRDPAERWISKNVKVGWIGQALHLPLGEALVPIIDQALADGAAEECIRIRCELLTAIKDIPAGRLGHSPEAAHVLLAVRAAIDRICPEAGK